MHETKLRILDTFLSLSEYHKQESIGLQQAFVILALKLHAYDKIRPNICKNSMIPRKQSRVFSTIVVGSGSFDYYSTVSLLLFFGDLACIDRYKV